MSFYISILFGILLSLLSDLVFVQCFIFLKGVKCVGLGRRVKVGGVKQFLDTKKNLLHCERWSPVLILVQYTQADGARGIDIRVPEVGVEPALWGLCGIFVGEGDDEGVSGALPYGSRLARNTDVPVHEIELSIRSLAWFGEEAKRVVFSPLFSVIKIKR